MIRLLILLSIFATRLYALPTTDDCGEQYGCFLQPSNCVNSNCVFIYKWFENKTAKTTNFELNVKVSEPIDNGWLGIGFSKDGQMGDSCLVICKYLEQNNIRGVDHSYAPTKTRPSLLVPDEPSIGLSNMALSVESNFLTCKFTRKIQMESVTNYYNLSNKYYVLGATGKVSVQNNAIMKHQVTTNSKELIDFSTKESVGSATRTKSQIHGCLMVFLWMFCASTGILIARYYKYLFPEKEILKLKIWFVIHRPLMVFVGLVSVAAFIIVLSDLNWKWVGTENTVAFSHSIVGIVTISLSLIQIIVGSLRCDKDHPKRFIFNHLHRFFGILTYLLSNAALYLGVSIDFLDLGTVGWVLLLIWNVWIFVFIVTQELLQKKFTKTTDAHYDASSKQLSDERISILDPSASLNKIKSVMLIFHLIAGLVLSIALMVWIFSPINSSN